MKQGAISGLAQWGHLRLAVRMVVMAMTAVVLVFSWSTWVTERPDSGSGYQNLRFAHNLLHHGVFARTEDPDQRPDPSNYREPLPPTVIAGYMMLAGPFLGDTSSIEALNKSPQVRIVKFVNFFWGAILAAAIFAAIVKLSGSYMLAGLGAIFASWPLRGEFDRLNGEVEAAALLGLSSLLISLAVSRRSPIYFALAGLSMGALILTKAAFLYVAIGLILLLGAWSTYRLWQRAERRSRVFGCVVLFPLMLAVPTLPWMARNYVHFGVFEITERSGAVLMIRALKNEMNWIEYRGAFYVWAPRYDDTFFASWAPARYRKEIGEFLGGFTRSDLERGGRLQRLNRSGSSAFAKSDRQAESNGQPEFAVTYYRSARGWRTKLISEWQARNHPSPEHAAERELVHLASGMILRDPLSHLVMTVVFLWRGAAYTFPILLAFAALALVRRQLDMVAYALPALGAVLFYALFSHFIPRYALPMDAVAVACFLVLAYMAARWLIGLGLVGWQAAAQRVGGGRAA